MKALLLSAGLGKRLRPLTESVPKCLVQIHGRPLLDYWLDILTSAEVYPILINLHHLADKVRQFVQNSKYAPFVKMVYESNLLGTGGTVLKNKDFFGNDSFMLIHGDNLSVFDVRAFIESHKNRPPECEITMMTFHSSTPQTCGIVELDGRGVVKDFYEKVSNPPSNLANGAVYILEPSVFAYLESLGPEVIDFSNEILPNYLGRIYTFHNNVYHRDIGSVESLAVANVEFNKRHFP